MGVLPARLLFLAFIGLTGCIIYNALYLQDLHGIPVAGSSWPRQVAATSVSAPTDTAKLPPVSTDLPPLNVKPGASDLLLRAVQRELATRGFDVGPIDGKPSDKTRAAISSYQKSQGLPVTGVASDEAITTAVQEVFSFKPARIIEQLNLLRPIYSKTTNYGHFGKVDDTESITWEKTDKAAALKKAVR